MRRYYSLNLVEEYITKAYRQNDITSPHDLDISRISDIWSIHLEYTNTTRAFAQWDSSTRRIFLPNKLSKAEQRVAYFHELGHVLRHAGNQRAMPKAFRDHQEVQAEQFILYASMPYFMIRDHLEDPPSVIAEEFQLPVTYVHKRLSYIQSKIIFNSEIGVRDDKPRWSQETIKVLHQLNHILLNKQHCRYYGT